MNRRARAGNKGRLAVIIVAAVVVVGVLAAFIIRSLITTHKDMFKDADRTISLIQGHVDGFCEGEVKREELRHAVAVTCPDGDSIRVNTKEDDAEGYARMNASLDRELDTGRSTYWRGREAVSTANPDAQAFLVDNLYKQQ